MPGRAGRRGPAMQAHGTRGYEPGSLRTAYFAAGQMPTSR